METFDAGWLALREPVDHRSRPPDLAARLARVWGALGWSRVADLGSGTGSNLRYLAPRLPGARDWLLCERDPDHVAALARIGRLAGGARVVARAADLDTELEAIVEAVDLVTASALLDLVSAGWLDRLVKACARRRRGALLALSYDGAIHWRCATADEDGTAAAFVREAVNRDQRRDKGFGAALGPMAAGAAARRFGEAGYHTWVAPSPWRLGTEDVQLARPLIAGWVAVAGASHPDRVADLERWGASRLAALAAGDCALEVGHADLLALPAGAA